MGVVSGPGVTLCLLLDIVDAAFDVLSVCRSLKDEYVNCKMYMYI